MAVTAAIPQHLSIEPTKLRPSVIPFLSTANSAVAVTAKPGKKGQEKLQALSAKDLFAHPDPPNKEEATRAVARKLAPAIMAKTIQSLLATGHLFIVTADLELVPVHAAGGDHDGGEKAEGEQ